MIIEVSQWKPWTINYRNPIFILKFQLEFSHLYGNSDILTSFEECIFCFYQDFYSELYYFGFSPVCTIKHRRVLKFQVFQTILSIIISAFSSKTNFTLLIKRHSHTHTHDYVFAFVPIAMAINISIGNSEQKG